MGKHLRDACSYANVVATLALFVASGGTSYAALRITGKQVADGSLTGRDIKNHSLTAHDIALGTLLARDFKAGQLPGNASGPAGPQGAAGTQGPQGLTGPPGPAGDTGQSPYRTRSTTDTNTDTSKEAQAVCPLGLHATGGGYALGPSRQSPVDIEVVTSVGRMFLGFMGGDGWVVDAKVIPGTSTSAPWSLTAYASCEEHA